MTLNEPLIVSPLLESHAGSGKLSMDPSNTQRSAAPSILLDYTLDLATYSENNYENVKAFVYKVFEKTLNISKQSSSHRYSLKIAPLKGGITNMLLKGTLEVSSGDAVHFLIRAYGKGTESFIDRDREFYTHLHLNELGLAPSLYARFGNGLIYEYIPGKALHYTELSNEEMIPAIASRTAQWHIQINSQHIQDQLETRGSVSTNPPKDIWEIIKQWIDIVPEDIAGRTREEFRKEVEWIRYKIGHTSPMCTSHCDLLAGNILVSESWTPKASNNQHQHHRNDDDKYAPSDLVSFIDYEYAIPAPRAFDLANHFAEWQGFDGRKDLIPEPTLQNPVLRRWMHHYLRAENYYSNKADTLPSESEIDSLINEVAIWWGLPGFFWGIWAAIQATISDIDFDYQEFCEQRLGDYYRWKEDILPGLQL